MASGAFWQRPGWANTLPSLDQTPGGPVSARENASSSAIPGLPPGLALNASGQVVWDPPLPSVENGFAPTSGSNVLYTEGGILKVAV